MEGHRNEMHYAEGRTIGTGVIVSFGYIPNSMTFEQACLKLRDYCKEIGEELREAPILKKYELVNR